MSSLHGKNLAMEMLMSDKAMPAWLVISSTRRPNRSIRYAATPVPATLTQPTMMLPKIGDFRPALVKTCMLTTVKVGVTFSQSSRNHVHAMLFVFRRCFA